MSLRPQHPLFTAFGLPLARALAWLLLTVFGPCRIFQGKRLPREGGVLLLANHLSDLDPIVVQMASRRPVIFMAKSELFEMRGLGRVIRWFGAFPVKRGEPDREAIKRAVALLQAGHVVCVFPEGQLSESGELQELKPGVALIVRMAKTPVICLGLTRTNAVMPYGKVTPRFTWGLFSGKWVEARWGEARSFEAHAGADEVMAWAESELKALTGP